MTDLGDAPWATRPPYPGAPSLVERADRRAVWQLAGERLQIAVTVAALAAMFVVAVRAHATAADSVSFDGGGSFLLLFFVGAAWLACFAATVWLVTPLRSGLSLLAVSAGLAGFALDQRLLDRERWSIDSLPVHVAVGFAGLCWIGWSVWASVPTASRPAIDRRGWVVAGLVLALLVAAWLLVPEPRPFAID